MRSRHGHDEQLELVRPLKRAYPGTGKGGLDVIAQRRRRERKGWSEDGGGASNPRCASSISLNQRPRRLSPVLLGFAMC